MRRLTKNYFASTFNSSVYFFFFFSLFSLEMTQPSNKYIRVFHVRLTLHRAFLLGIDLSIERESRKKNNRLEDRYLRRVFPANYELL